jgi:hypothetical protein
LLGPKALTRTQNSWKPSTVASLEKKTSKQRQAILQRYE